MTLGFVSPSGSVRSQMFNFMKQAAGPSFSLADECRWKGLFISQSLRGSVQTDCYHPNPRRWLLRCPVASALGTWTISSFFPENTPSVHPLSIICLRMKSACLSYILLAVFQVTPCIALFFHCPSFCWNAELLADCKAFFSPGPLASSIILQVELTASMHWGNGGIPCAVQLLPSESSSNWQ